MTTEPRPPPPWLTRRMLGVLAFVLCWAGLVWRRPDQWFTPQFIAEDGFVFFHDAIALGWASLLKPFAGYLHLTPRIIANLCAPVPWEFQPLVYVVAASIVAALVGVRIALARLPLPVRLLGVVALIAVPHRGEVFLTITNLHWILGAVLVVNLLEPPPSSTGETARRAGEILLVGLSGPMTVILAPFALAWAWAGRRQAMTRVILLAWGLTMVVQAGFILTSERTLGTNLSSVPADLRWLVPQYTAAFLINAQLPYSAGLGWAAVLLVTVSLALLFADRTNRQRWVGGGMLLAAAILLLAGRTALPYWPHPQGNGARYTYLPFVLCLWTFTSLAFGTEKRLPRILALLLYAMALWASASAWVAEPLPDDQWAQQVRAAREGTRREFHILPVDVFPVPSAPR